MHTHLGYPLKPYTSVNSEDTSYIRIHTGACNAHLKAKVNKIGFETILSVISSIFSYPTIGPNSD